MIPKRFAAAAISLAALLCAREASFAQSTDQPTYVVTYIEAAPKAAAEARELIVARCAVARKAGGLIQIEAFARTGYPSQFATLATSSSGAGLLISSSVIMRMESFAERAISDRESSVRLTGSTICFLVLAVSQLCSRWLTRTQARWFNPSPSRQGRMPTRMTRSPE